MTSTRTPRRFPRKPRPTAVPAPKRDPVPAAAPLMWWMRDLDTDDDNAATMQPGIVSSLPTSISKE
jgi:hypothetical protein